MLVASTHISDWRHTEALQAVLRDIDAPDWMVVFGDRSEMLVRALQLHYEGRKLIHVCGGDTPHGCDTHPDHRTRDAISMLARVHCVSNVYAAMNLADMGLKNVFVTGAPGLDEVVRYEKSLDPNRKRFGIFQWIPEDPVTYTPTNQPRLTQQEFLHKLAHAELFVTNSSAGMYEAPILGTPVQWVGKRQDGRHGPFHDKNGRACEKIRQVILEVCE